MTSRLFRWVFLALIAIFATYVYWWRQAILAADSEIGTSPFLLGYSLAICISYWLLVRRVPLAKGSASPALFRRFVAFYLDFFFAFLAILPWLGLITVLTEWHRTGLFRWVVKRTTSAPDDGWIGGVAMSAFALWLLIYFAYPLKRERPSPGTCIMGYRIAADYGREITAWVALDRVIKGSIALGFWPITLFIGRNKDQGKLWFDKTSRTHAETLE